MSDGVVINGREYTWAETVDVTKVLKLLQWRAALLEAGDRSDQLTALHLKLEEDDIVRQCFAWPARTADGGMFFRPHPDDRAVLAQAVADKFTVQSPGGIQ
jgi:hypothetical protein